MLIMLLNEMIVVGICDCFGKWAIFLLLLFIALRITMCLVK